VPARDLVATAPVRICDVGGWTDTWFAGSGAVFSIAVEPLVVVEVRASPTCAGRILLAAPDLGERCDYVLGAPPGRLPLLEAAIGSATIPPGTSLEVSIHAGVPPGSGTGTSAAVVVALLAALDRLTPGVASPAALAAAAHRVETELLGQQSGVQDQLASAHGGINLFEVRYPEATAHPVPVDPAVRAELGDRIVLVALGHPHRSSAVHEEVIARLSGAGGGGGALDVLRALARDAAGALAAGDLERLGQAMRSATEAQRALHPALVSVQAQELVDVAAAAGASGWKVNGAGGDGGSLTFLAGPGAASRAGLLAAVGSLAGPHRVVPVRLARQGVSVVEGGARG
jgi:D-glycero-alpha-D-manno-heptose-7-phosphate kinase